MAVGCAKASITTCRLGGCHACAWNQAPLVAGNKGSVDVIKSMRLSFHGTGPMDGCGLGCVVPRHAKVAAQSGKLDLKATRVQNAGVPSCLGTLPFVPLASSPHRRPSSVLNRRLLSDSTFCLCLAFALPCFFFPCLLLSRGTVPGSRAYIHSATMTANPASQSRKRPIRIANCSGAIRFVCTRVVEPVLTG